MKGNQRLGVVEVEPQACTPALDAVSLVGKTALSTVLRMTLAAEWSLICESPTLLGGVKTAGLLSVRARRRTADADRNSP